MSFSYYDKNNNIKKIDVKVGMSWAELKTDNEKLNSIFGQIDDGDGIVQFTEKGILEDFIEQIDSSGSGSKAPDNVLDELELNSFNQNNAYLQSNINKNYFNIENIKKEFPEDKFEFIYDDLPNNDASIISGTIINRATNKEVMVFEYNKSTHNFFIDESTEKNKSYYVQYGAVEALSLQSKDAEECDYELIYENNQVTTYANPAKSEYLYNNFIGAKILFNEYSRPEWINNNSIEYLSNLPTKDLRDFINLYHYLNPYTGILEEIKNSDGIDNNVKTEFLNNTLKKLEKEYGYNPKLSIESSRITTDFYKSNEIYSVSYNNDIITIKELYSDNDTPEERQIDLNILLEKLPIDLHPKIKTEIQNLPGEVLMDMAIECSQFGEIPRHTEYMLGAFSTKNDNISVGFLDIEGITASTIAHEIGHAIDHRRLNAVPQGNENPAPNNDQRAISSRTNPDFIFEYELARYEALGLKKYLIIDYDSKIFQLDNFALEQAGFKKNGEWTNKYLEKEENLTNIAYMYTSPTEGPSELYCTAMLGESETTQKRFIPQRLMNEYLKMLAYTRSLAPEDRHIKEF